LTIRVVASHIEENTQVDCI